MVMNTHNTNSHKLELLISHDEIALRIKELAKDISSDYEGKSLVIIALLKGAFIFLADLVRELTLPLHIDFMNISSYDGKTPSGEVKHHYGPLHDVKGKHVIIVEDIIDTGATIKSIIEKVNETGAIDVKVCSLLKREDNHNEALAPDYVGFTIKEGFLVGYGLDYNEDYRNLKGLFKLKQ
jgi:hypoxanthine phosphoribosyltransferase